MNLDDETFLAYQYRSNQYLALLEQLHLLLGFHQWQPENTAPTDTPVLVFDGNEIAVGDKAPRGSWFINNPYGFCEDGQIRNVSHWMPLPKPPKKELE